VLSKNTRLEDGADIGAHTEIIYHEDIADLVRPQFISVTDLNIEDLHEAQTKQRNTVLVSVLAGLAGITAFVIIYRKRKMSEK
jgi:hypothetical protein